MTKKSSTLGSTIFALKILSRIPRAPRAIDGPTLLKELAEDGYDREKRTMERYLLELSEAFQISRDERGKPYRYFWPKEAKSFNVPLMTEHDALLLTLAHQHLKRLLPASLISAMDSFFEQARYALGLHSDSKLAKEWLDKVIVVSDTQTQPLISPAIAPDIFEIVSNALYYNKLLEVTYKNARGSTWTRTVQPLGLAQQEQRFYLVCYMPHYEEERNLALHRMLSAKEGFQFERPLDFSLQQYERDQRFAFGNGHQIKLLFRVDKNQGCHLLETKLSEDQIERDLDDEWEILATVVDAARLNWWLNGFGDAVSLVYKVPLDTYRQIHDYVLTQRVTQQTVVRQELKIKAEIVKQVFEMMETAKILSRRDHRQQRTLLVN